MDQLVLQAQPRVRDAKGANRRLRASGQVPAVVYGGTGEPRSIAINLHEMELILRGATKTNKIFNLTLEGGNEQTIARDIQRHPVNSRVWHVDFQRIDLESELEVDVTIHVVGQSPLGVRNGGILEHIQRTVRVLCKPLDMPKFLEADLSELDLNRSYHVSDLTLPAGVQVLDELDMALFTVAPPKTEEVVAPVAGAAEPEVVGAKKEPAAAAAKPAAGGKSEK